MPDSQSISVPYTSNVTKLTFLGIGIRRALCPAARPPRALPAPSACSLSRGRAREPFVRVARRHGLVGVPGQAAVRPPRPEGLRGSGRRQREGGAGGGGADRLPGRG